jgi:hypothetical protein
MDGEIMMRIAIQTNNEVSRRLLQKMVVSTTLSGTPITWGMGWGICESRLNADFSEGTTVPKNTIHSDFLKAEQLELR